jgi:acetylornithine deacetylase/succinyl-diaminopimelate desuccinylase-like protein
MSMSSSAARIDLDPVDLLEELVRIDSANPATGGPGEEAVATFLAGVLTDLGLDVSMPEVVPGRRNLIARLPGRSDAPRLLLEAHLDTVAHPEGGLEIRRDGGRFVGRGACDTKASCAAMIAAIASLVAAGHTGGDVVFAGAVDEEAVMLGSRALVDQLPAVSGAVIGEPTSMRPVRAHNGLIRFRITAHGRAAHSSQAHLGVNAVSVAARIVTALDEQLMPTLRARAHPLTGQALLTSAVIQGGVAPNVVPDRCHIDLDRRLGPGEDPAEALSEIDRVLEGIAGAGHRFTRHEPSTVLPAVETSADHPLIRAAEEAVETVLGSGGRATGVPYGTDASNLSGLGGIPCLVLGPGSIDQAHTADEWVPIEEIGRAARIYEELVRGFTAPRTGSSAEASP